MVTAKTQYSLANAKRYFAEHLAVGDYYQEGQKVSGEWFGLGVERLGIAGRVQANDFLALCDNLNPSTGERLTVRMKTVRDDDGRLAANRRIFYDFTFSPPKSVSIVALVANDRRVVKSHHRALQEALREFERFAAGRIRTNHRRDQQVTGNVVAAMFTHDSSRSLDPHLHTHCIVFNATFDESEGRWKALENYEMLRARKFIENLYYHELAKDLRHLGYSIQNTPRGDFEIEGVGKELCERFSKRHQQIDDAVTALVANKPELAGANVKELRERLATAERARKMRDVAPEELRTVWTSQLSAGERASLNELANRPAGEPEPPATQGDVLEAITWAEEHLFDRNSVVFEHDIWETALRRARGKAVSIEALKAATARRGYLRDKRISWQVTMEETLRQEWEIVSLARGGIGQQGIVEIPALSVPLDSEQTIALQRLVASRDFVTLFRGGAGTGKSYVLRELARVLELNGSPVRVVAPQRQQVVDLEAAGLPAPTTVASFLLQESIAPRSVIIVDEAGQIGARQMLELFRKAAEIGGRLVLSGDTRQHGPVEASDALVAIERYAGLKPAELHSIRRQDPKVGRGRREKAAIGQYRRAVLEAAQGKLWQSFDRLDRLGAVVGCQTNEQQDRLAREYVQLADEGFSTVVVSQTWSEVHRVNEKVRAALKEKGNLGADDTMVSVLDKLDLTSAQKRDRSEEHT